MPKSPRLIQQPSWPRWTMLAGLAILFAISAPGSPESFGQSEVRSLLNDSVTDADPAQYPNVAGAIIRFRNGDVLGAKSLLITASNTHPHLPPGSVMLAQLHFAAQQLDAGRAALEEAIRESPEDPEPYLVMGDFAYRQRWITSAHLAFSRADELSQAYDANEKRKRNLRIRAIAGLTAAAETRENWELAHDHLREWLNLDGENALAHGRLGRVLFEMKDYKSAYAEFQHAHENDPSSLRQEISIALLYENQEEGSLRAEKLMGLAVQRDPDTLTTRLAVARWELDRENLDAAREQIDAALELDDSSLETHLFSGLLHRFASQHDAAQSEFEWVHLRSPANHTSLNQLALALVAQDDVTKQQRALQFAQIGVRVHADLSQVTGREAAAVYAWVLHRNGRSVEAQRTLQSTLRAGGLTPESTYFVARILNQAGNAHAARQLLENSLQNDSNFPTRAEAEALFQQLQ